MTSKRKPGAGRKAPSAPDFDPVTLRYRRDGWTPGRQVAFIKALAQCGCVLDACRRVGMSSESAYELARRPDAQSFRLAWEIAMDNAVRRIGDEAFSRCIQGVAVPHFYKGELVGEHRRYDERLTMFILKYRDPLRYGSHLDRAEFRGHVEEKAIALGYALEQVRDDALREAAGLPRAFVRDIPVANDDEEDEDDDLLEGTPRGDGGPGAKSPGEGCPAPDVASTSSTSSGGGPAGGGFGPGPVL